MPLNMLYMMGYCHRSETLVDDLTVEEHFTLFTAVRILILSYVTAIKTIFILRFETFKQTYSTFY